MDTNLNTGPIEQRVCDHNAYSVFNRKPIYHIQNSKHVFKVFFFKMISGTKHSTLRNYRKNTVKHAYREYAYKNFMLSPKSVFYLPFISKTYFELITRVTNYDLYVYE